MVRHFGGRPKNAYDVELPVPTPAQRKSHEFELFMHRPKQKFPRCINRNLLNFCPSYSDAELSLAVKGQAKAECKFCPQRSKMLF